MGLSVLYCGTPYRYLIQCCSSEHIIFLFHEAHPDADFVTDLLHDIEFGVRVGYQPATRAFQTYDNHLSARTNPGPVTLDWGLNVNLI